MAIFFSCLCGQNLREPDERAGSPSCCPVCGLRMRIPFLRHPDPLGGSASDSADDSDIPQLVPLVPTLELRAVEVPAPPYAPPPLRRHSPPPPEQDEDDTYPLARDWHDLGGTGRQERAEARRLLSRAVRDLKEKRFLRRSWPLEKHWFEFLAYPLRALPCVLLLAVAWATLTAILGAVMPDGWDATEIVTHLPVLLPVLMIVFVLFGYTIAFFQATYGLARAGTAGFIAWPGKDLGATVRGGTQGLLAFLAGPIVPAVVGFLFWLGSGELNTLDWLILWELGIVAAAYWALALLAVQRNMSLCDLRPAAVMKSVRQSGFRAPLTALLLAIPAVGQALQTLEALDSPQRNPAGWLIAVLCWIGQLSWVVFILRWFGVNRFRVTGNVPSVRSQSARAEPRLVSR